MVSMFGEARTANSCVNDRVCAIAAIARTVGRERRIKAFGSIAHVFSTRLMQVRDSI